jgi:hypothetical protein
VLDVSCDNINSAILSEVKFIARFRMSIIDKIIKQFIAQGYATPETIVGCTDDEIEAIEQAQNIKVPDIYREFLSKMGKKAGSFHKGSDILFPALLNLKSWMNEALDGDIRAAFRLPPNAFVFKSHQGYMYSYFVYNPENLKEDPLVYNYDEFRTPVPIPLNKTYSEWLITCANEPRYF